VERHTRKELKTDKFVLEVENIFDYVVENPKQVGIYAGAILLALIIGFGVRSYITHARGQRQQALADAIEVTEAPVGQPATMPGALSFPTAEAQQTEAIKRFNVVITKYPGSDEAVLAASYLGAIYGDQGNMADAEKYYQQVIRDGNENYASLGKFAMAQIYFSTNRSKEGEQMLRALIDKPTAFVSKEQATLALAHQLAATNPAEARKLLEPLGGSRQAVSQAAMTALATLPK
jgi:predicted negative regulator of RcsB-dependent stress response